ncbi:MAG: glycosyltransferase [Bacteroidales bacterium]
MTTKKVVCLLPLYLKDNPQYLYFAINSIIGEYCHVVVLCDGPITKQHEHVLEQLSGEISILKFPNNRGLAAVLNDGIRYAFEQGYEFIARMDADDISLPDRFEKQINFLRQHPDVDVVGGAIEEIDENGHPRGKIIRYPLTHEECYRFFAKRDPLAHPAVLFRRRFFEKAGLYNEAYRKNQDTQLWYAGFKNGCIFANIPDVVLQFRITEDLFKSRRSGWNRAKKMLADRWKINRELNYGASAYLFAIAMFVLTIMPSWIRKWAYQVFR